MSEQINPPPTDKAAYAEILRDCADIADERGQSYGPAESNFRDIAHIHKAMWGEEVDVQHIAKLFISTKVSRNKVKDKRDNGIDGINYWAILQYFKDNGIV